MSWIDGMTHRLRVRLSPERYAAEMAEEQRFHEEMKARAGAGDPRGDGPEEPSSILDRVTQDLSYAVRGLRRSPGFTAVVTTTLALGVGANAAVFSMLDRLFNQPPAGVRDPDGLRRLYVASPARIDDDGLPRAFGSWSHTAYAAIESVADGAYDAAAWIPSSEARLGVGDAEISVRLSFVSHDYFDVLGVGERVGRLFGLEESRLDVGSPVAVISHALWERAFAADPDVVGRDVTIDGASVTVIGVTAERFAGVELGYTDVFLPLGMFSGGPFPEVPWHEESREYMRAVARLQTGVSDEQLSERATAGYVRRPIPRCCGRFVHDSTQIVIAGSVIETRGPGRRAGTADHRQAISISTRTMAVSGILLLIASANMAGLLLVRAAQRRREIGVRIALGISRARLGFQLVVEGLLLALLGGLAGGFAAGVGGRALRGLLLPEVRWADPLVEPRTMAFALVVTTATGLLVGLAPMVQVSRSASWIDLKAGTSGGAPRSILRSGLIGAQVALSVVLLVGAGLFVRSSINANAVRLGFDVSDVAFVAQLDPSPGGSDNATAVNDLMRTLSEAPGVRGVALASSPPLLGAVVSRFFIREGDDGRPEAQTASLIVSPSYFDVVGTRIVEGRGFAEGELMSVVVDETMARAYWPGRSALGQCMVFGQADGPCREVVGVAEAQRFRVVQDEAGPWYFLPLLSGASAARSVLLRVEPRRWPEVAEVSRQAVAGRFNVRNVRIGTMFEVVEPQLRPWRVGVRLFGVFGALALLITAVGVYGVISYSVSQRTHEMGVRMALGARLGSVVRLVLSDGLRAVCVGAALGLVAVMALGRSIESFLYGVTPSDPVIAFLTIAVLMTAGAMASLLPALRAGRVDPAEVLRQD